MPARDPFESPNAQRLRIGQGIPGGASGLPSRQAGPPLPVVKPPPRPLQRVAPLSPPGYAIPSPAGSKPQPLSSRGAAVLKRGDFGALITRELRIASGKQTLNKTQQKTLNLLMNKPKALLDPKNSEHLRQALAPNTVISAVADNHPVLSHHRDVISKHLNGDPIATIGGHLMNESDINRTVNAAAEHQARTAPTTWGPNTGFGANIRAGMGQPAPAVSPLIRHQAQVAAAGMPIPAMDLERKLVTQIADTGIGLGPGLYHLAGGELHHPGETNVNLVKAIAHSYGQTIHDPAGQLKEDPLGLITNLTTPFFMGAGGVARGAQLARLGAEGTTLDLSSLSMSELRQAAKVYGIRHVGMNRSFIEDQLRAHQYHRIDPSMEATAKNVLKTLWRPQPMQRTVVGPGGVTATGAGYKSALGGYLGRARDWELSRRLAKDPNAFRQFLDKHNIMQSMKPEAAFARRLRRDLDIGQRQMAGAPLEGPAGAARLANARATTHFKIHHDFWQMGTPGEILEHERVFGNNPDVYKGLVPVRKPPKAMPKVDQKLWNSEKAVSKRFQNILGQRQQAIDNPEKFRWVDEQYFHSSKPYEPTSGRRPLDWVDRGTQLIRSGRFLHPGYLQWAVQNGIIHTTQAGALVFRNAYKRATEYRKLPEELQQQVEGGVGGGIAAMTEPGAKGYKPFIQRAQKFWHKVDDRDIRIMSFIHEAEAHGFHNAEGWTNLLTNPRLEKTRTAVFHQADREPISYTEMTPRERETIKKLTTSWAWTRGASTWSGRFALQHPIQARVGEEVGQEGSKRTEDYYAKLGGMAPAWLKGFYPFGKAGLLESGILNPAETPGKVIGELPGFTVGQTENLLGEASPVAATLSEMFSGTNRFGNRYKGANARVTEPLGELARRYEPIGAISAAFKKGGTFESGLKAGAFRYAGVPYDKLRNPTKTASLGEKDYEQSLSSKELLDFRLNDRMNRIPREIEQMKKANLPVPSQMISQYKGDLEAEHALLGFQLDYASHHGAKSYKSLPAQNKLEAALTYAKAHGWSDSDIRSYQAAASQATGDKVLENLASSVFTAASHGAGHIVRSWKDLVTKTKPPTVTPKQ